METTIEKAVMVTFENYYSKMQKQLVIGTIDEKKAIKAVKEDQCNRKCDVKKTEVFKNVKTNELDLDYAIILNQNKRHDF